MAIQDLRSLLCPIRNQEFHAAAPQQLSEYTQRLEQEKIGL
jgi:hypothetical protein